MFQICFLGFGHFDSGHNVFVHFDIGHSNFASVNFTLSDFYYVESASACCTLYIGRIDFVRYQNHFVFAILIRSFRLNFWCLVTIRRDILRWAKFNLFAASCFVVVSQRKLWKKTKPKTMSSIIKPIPTPEIHVKPIGFIFMLYYFITHIETSVPIVDIIRDALRNKKARRRTSQPLKLLYVGRRVLYTWYARQQCRRQQHQQQIQNQQHSNQQISITHLIPTTKIDITTRKMNSGAVPKIWSPVHALTISYENAREWLMVNSMFLNICICCVIQFRHTSGRQ